MVGTSQQAEYTPKLVTVWREGYGPGALRADVMAGLTVAIVALPLSMAIAIASGVGPERGLYTAIVGGFLVSALGGSRYQIGGPAGAFIVLVSACVTAIGIEGLILATFLSGLVLIAAGLLRLGTYVRYIPYPVTVGFTTGIAVIILASQLREMFGLTLAGPEPGEMLPKLEALWAARGTVTWAAAGVAGMTVAVILGLRRVRPHWPGMLIAIALTSGLVAGLGLPVATIGERFGELPHLLPAPALPDLSLWRAALPWALSFALLGAIESLLSAVVADGMSGARHRSNAELVAQGLANIGSAIFGGFCVTGTIARTATNVRAGSRGPVSGMLHAVFLALFMALAAPLAANIPLAALAGILAVVAWNMAEKTAIRDLFRTSRADALVLAVTLLLVIFRDLTEGIVVGFALAGLVFIQRMSKHAAFDLAPEEDPGSGRVLLRLSGPWFFAAAAQVGATLDRIAEKPGIFVLDLSGLAYVDTSGAHALELLARRIQRKGGTVELRGVTPDQRRVLEASGLRAPLVVFADA